MIVMLIVAGVPSAAPVADDSVIEKVSSPSIKVSSIIGTLMFFAALSPSAQLSVPLVAA